MVIYAECHVYLHIWVPTTIPRNMALMDSGQAPQPEVASYAPGLLLLAPHRHSRARPKWKDPLLISKGYPGDPDIPHLSMKICRNHYIFGRFFGSHPKKISARPHPAWTKLPRVTSKISTSWWSLCLFSWTWSTCCESDGLWHLPWWNRAASLESRSSRYRTATPP